MPDTQAAQGSWFSTKVIEPTKQLTSRQLFATVVIGVWGGVFPIPVTTTVALFGVIGLSNMMPAARSVKFNVPMTTLATAVNVAVIPLDLMMLPVFFRRSCQLFGSTPQQMGCEITDSFISDIQEKPLEMVTGFSTCFALAVLLWCLLTPMVVLAVSAVAAGDAGARLPRSASSHIAAVL